MEYAIGETIVVENKNGKELFICFGEHYNMIDLHKEKLTDKDSTELKHLKVDNEMFDILNGIACYFS